MKLTPSQLGRQAHTAKLAQPKIQCHAVHHAQPQFVDRRQAFVGAVGFTVAMSVWLKAEQSANAIQGLTAGRIPGMQPSSNRELTRCYVMERR
jgi:hypothetical protein